MKTITNNILILIITITLFSCGIGKVDLNEAEYQPKIVIDGYVFPNQQVSNIRISRNIPLNQGIDLSKIILKDAIVKIIDIETNKTYLLSFNPSKLSFEYVGNDLIIKSGNSYKLEVNAKIDDKEYFASSTTTVPQTGLKILKPFLDSLKYRETDAEGNLKKFKMDFNISPGVNFYAISITALDAKLDNFIYDNVYRKIDSNDVKKDFDRYRQRSQFILNAKPDAIQLDYTFEWGTTYFYGNYKVILYATDINFKHFLLSHRNVMEMDGNFHEPKFHIEGDGIGVFGSAVTDTCYFKVRR